MTFCSGTGHVRMSSQGEDHVARKLLFGCLSFGPTLTKTKLKDNRFICQEAACRMDYMVQLAKVQNSYHFLPLGISKDYEYFVLITGAPNRVSFLQEIGVALCI